MQMMAKVPGKKDHLQGLAPLGCSKQCPNKIVMNEVVMSWNINRNQLLHLSISSRFSAVFQKKTSTKIRAWIIFRLIEGI
ncbi:hypothetical protein AQUCO_00900488v1 [Aquilegia coerulea]|uniref:Uncharacterized protein n=1 Tax=Aquilegia coerulea TaxID=218851 RepID=A0A2G5EDV4_AQUCA|nr:hypothetical protein AQUCO_00900488v1 [Aquilegia coerulea]